MAKFSLKILESDAEIKRRIERALAYEVKSRLRSIGTTLKKPIGNIIRKAIIGSPEYAAIIWGRLHGDLGIPNPVDAMNDIIEVWMKSVIISVDAEITKDVLAVITIAAINARFKDVLEHPSAKFTSVHSAHNTAFNVEWLKWLLFEGVNYIVKDFVVKHGSFKSPIPSRTGDAVMINIPGRGWGIPAAYAGTVEDNFVTRAIDQRTDEIVRAIQEEFRKLF